MLNKLFLFLLLLVPFAVDAEGRLEVSAENPDFGNHFAGSMVVEVVVYDRDRQDIGSAEGEPDVTINGQKLRMVQALNGNWYAYFADYDGARAADATVGLAGEGLDFGVFCSSDTPPSVFGVSFPDTDGFAVPRSGGLEGFADGDSKLSACSGTPSGPNHNNVVRNAKSINTNSGVLAGQIGLSPDAWPLVHLFSFDHVTILYNAAGQTHEVSLEYGDIPGISASLDRDTYPVDSEVFLIINDFQLNQDPTDQDSWTFDVGSGRTFYQAFDSSGASAANGGLGLVDIAPHLASIGFEENGRLEVILDSVLEIHNNTEQPLLATDRTDTFAEIVTLVEDASNSGIFDTADRRNKSVLKTSGDAPRGHAGSIEYNGKTVQAFVGPFTADIYIAEPSLTVGEKIRPGTEFPIILVDPDQNQNSGSRDSLDMYSDSSKIPTLKIGNPITLADASDVRFHASSNPLDAGIPVDSFVSDPHSQRLMVDTSSISGKSFEAISMDLGVSASQISSLFTESGDGTNWLHYDLRSIGRDLTMSDFSDTSVYLLFGSDTVVLADSGDLSSAGLMYLRYPDLSTKVGPARLVIDFDYSYDSDEVGLTSDEHIHPITVDLFSFGTADSENTNNAIYRFELEETSNNSGIFEGTAEYSVANQINVHDPDLVKTMRFTGDQIRFLILGGEDDVSVLYSDLNSVGILGTISARYDTPTNTGTVFAESSYRFNRPITVTLNDPDLNLDSGLRDLYLVVDDPTSSNVDTVGRNGDILLEVKLRDIRYKRCIVDGVAHGGLASTGFVLAETGANTGVFVGTFNIPSKICNKYGTELISPAGGSLDVRYYDSHDASGNPRVLSLLGSRSVPAPDYIRLSADSIARPILGETFLTLSGSIASPVPDAPLSVTITFPDGQSNSTGHTVMGRGSYNIAVPVNESSDLGVYIIEISYGGDMVGTASFVVSAPEISYSIKNGAKMWSASLISDSEFLDRLDMTGGDLTIPDWFKNNAGWWTDGLISDKDFITSLQYLVKKDIIGS